MCNIQTEMQAYLGEFRSRLPAFFAMLNIFSSVTPDESFLLPVWKLPKAWPTRQKR